MEKYLYEDLAMLEDSHWWHRAKREAVLELIHTFNKTKNPKILDIGCGTGKNVEEFGKIGQAFGIDSSKEAISFCRRKALRNVKLATSDKTGFGSTSFDLVTMLDVLEHVEERKTLGEIHRILKNRGLLIITVPAFSWLWSRWDEVLHHKRRYTKQNLVAVLRDNGLEIEKVSYLYSFLVLPAILVRAIKSTLYKKDYPSDFKLSSASVNRVMGALSDFEREVMLRISVPFGTSLICVARKVENNFKI